MVPKLFKTTFSPASTEVESLPNPIPKEVVLSSPVDVIVPWLFIVRFFVLPAPITLVDDVNVPVLLMVVPPVFLDNCIAAPYADSIVPLLVMVWAASLSSCLSIRTVPELVPVFVELIVPEFVNVIPEHSLQ